MLLNNIELEKNCCALLSMRQETMDAAQFLTASDMGVHLYTDFGFVKNGNFMQYKL